MLPPILWFFCLLFLRKEVRFVGLLPGFSNFLLPAMPLMSGRKLWICVVEINVFCEVFKLASWVVVK